MPRGSVSTAPEALLVSTMQAAELLNCSRPSVYRLVQEGRLREVRIGDRRLIVRESIDAFVYGSEAI